MWSTGLYTHQYKYSFINDDLVIVGLVNSCRTSGQALNTVNHGDTFDFVWQTIILYMPSTWLLTLYDYIDISAYYDISIAGIIRFNTLQAVFSSAG